MTNGWLRAGLIAMLAGWSACAFDADYHRTRYRCDDGACPSGYACRQGYCEPVDQGAQPSGLQGCGTTDLLGTSFEDDQKPLQDALWDSYGSNIGFPNVEGKLEARANNPEAVASGVYYTNRLYLLRNSSVSVEVPDYDPATGGRLTFDVNVDDATDVRFELDRADLRLTYEVGDNRYLSRALDYDPTAHRYWQVREAQGTLYWEASSDAETWELLSTTSSVPFTGLVRIELAVNLPIGATPVHVDNVNGGAPATDESWCAVSGLSDDFNDGLVGDGWWAWNDNNCRAYERNGVVIFDYTADGPSACGYESKTYYDLTGSSIAVEVPKVDETGTIRTRFVLQFQDNKEIAFEHANLSETQKNLLVCRNNLSDAAATPCTLKYDQDVHRWWRFRHDEGTARLHWETSPDGRSWTSQGQYDVSDVVFPGAVVHLVSDSYIETGRTDVANQFDNLNTGR